jgi:hypothetical protein
MTDLAIAATTPAVSFTFTFFVSFFVHQYNQQLITTSVVSSEAFVKGKIKTLRHKSEDFWGSKSQKI